MANSRRSSANCSRNVFISLTWLCWDVCYCCTFADPLRERDVMDFSSPNKAPAVRLEMLRQAGKRRVPFTTRLLISIGNKRLLTLETIAELYAVPPVLEVLAVPSGPSYFQYRQYRRYRQYRWYRQYRQTCRYSQSR